MVAASYHWHVTLWQNVFTESAQILKLLPHIISMLLYDHTHFPKETVANSCCLISLACCSMTRQEGSRSIPNTVAASYHWHVTLRHGTWIYTRWSESLLPHIIGMLLYDNQGQNTHRWGLWLPPHIIGMVLYDGNHKSQKIFNAQVAASYHWPVALWPDCVLSRVQRHKVAASYHWHVALWLQYF